MSNIELTEDQIKRAMLFRRYWKKFFAYRDVRETTWQRITNRPPEWAKQAFRGFEEDFAEQIEMSRGVTGNAPVVEDESLLRDPRNFVWLDHPWKIPFSSEVKSGRSYLGDVNRILVPLLLRLVYQEEYYYCSTGHDNLAFDLELSQSIDRPESINILTFEMENAVNVAQIERFMENTGKVLEQERRLVSGEPVKALNGHIMRRNDVTEHDRSAVMAATPENVGKVFFSRLGFDEDAKNQCEALGIRMVSPEEISADIEKHMDED